MSLQFGKYNFDGTRLKDDFARARPIVSPYGPDSERSFQADCWGVLYFGFCTTKESRREAQPQVCSSGTVITFDGRLDNREDLERQLRDVVAAESTDAEIVAAAYQRWRTDCFSKMVGDWALSIVEPRDRTVFLAKDFLGTRHLYYSIEDGRLTWCTILDPLITPSSRTLQLNHEYFAGWLSFYPATHLTPYDGIHSIPPASFVCVTRERCRMSRYWDFDESKRVRYRSDTEYEMHFRELLTQSVRRRLRSDSPVLAELSGGMDSSSVVCIADRILSSGENTTSRLDTISYYDDSEPNWNERPYFSQVEAKRGRQGWHIDISSSAVWAPMAVDTQFGPVPGVADRSKHITDQFQACLTAQGNRVLLSGIGGDEVAGGVPTPTQELADLLASFMIRDLVHKLKVWALTQRRPWFHLLAETVRVFLPPTLAGSPEQKRPPAWLGAGLLKHYPEAATGYDSRLKFHGAMPSFQDNVATLNAIRRQLACDHPSADPLYETRYPFLDRDLLEFLFAVPRDQLVRPGQRRSLMRRSLAGIVPDGVLNRRRKAYVARSPLAALSRDAARLIENVEAMASTRLGIIDAPAFTTVMQRAKEGQTVAIVPLKRALDLECWLQNLIHRGAIHSPVSSPGFKPRRRTLSLRRVPGDSAS